MAGLKRSNAVATLVGVILLAAPWLLLAVLGASAGMIRAAIAPSAMVEEEGVGWRAQVTPTAVRGRLYGLIFEFPSDHGSSTTSSLRLFEDDRELGPSSAVHRDIRELGNGRFSHWRRDLFFSTSDNSDPRTNGRRYSIESPVEPSRTALLLAILASLAGAIVLWSSATVQGRTAGWRARWISGSERAALVVPWRAVPMPLGWRRFMVAAWVLCATVAAFIGRDEHDPYLLSTVPTTGYSDHTNSLPGYAAMMDGAPRHAENVQTWDHIAMFNGSIIAADMYANRPLYPFLASAAAWALGVAGASLLVNLLAWAVGTWAAVRVGAEFAGRFEAGVVAGLLACVGAGWWFHIGDYSAHLLSFSTSAVALLVILRSRIWAVRQPAEVHAAIAAVLVIASLAYNSGLFFAAAYFLLAIWRNRWWHVLLVALAAVLVQRLWPPLLNALSNGNFDYYAVERGLLQRALDAWPHMWQSGMWWQRAMDVFLDSLVPAATILPLIVLGVIAPILGGVRRSGSGDEPRPERGAVLLMLLVVVLPTVALIIYSPTATARGYLIFCASTAVFAVAGALFARLRPGAWRGLGAGVLLLGLVVQVILVTRHAEADARGVKLFLWGLPSWTTTAIEQARSAPRTQVAGFGGEPAPRVAGGDASLLECGASDGGEIYRDLPAFKTPVQVGQMLIVRGVMVLALGIGVHLVLLAGLMRLPGRSVRSPPSRTVLAAIMLAVLLVPPIAARLRGSGPEHQRHMIHDRRLPSRPTELVQEIELDPSSLLLLEQAAHAALASLLAREGVTDEHAVSDAELDCLTGFGWSQETGAGISVEIFAGDQPLTRFETEGSGRQRRRLDLSTALAALKRDPRIRIVARKEGGIPHVASWQRGDLPGRSLEFDGVRAEPSRDLPMPLFELRVVHRDRDYHPSLLLY